MFHHRVKSFTIVPGRLKTLNNRLVAVSKLLNIHKNLFTIILKTFQHRLKSFTIVSHNLQSFDNRFIKIVAKSTKIVHNG